MLTHAQIWSAIDGLAKRSGLSPSGLAKRAGLDPTTFNKSKRITADGRARWPSTESVAKSLAATGASIDQFVALITEAGQSTAEAVPLLGFAEAGAGGYFDDGGFPAGKGWDEIAFPAVDDEHVYALKISGDSMHPAYRDGTVIIVSPSASVHRGDRVVVRTRDGEVMAKELKRKTAKALELK
jgi:phage repressor protein C with HTH and peptisase S24 domain